MAEAPPRGEPVVRVRGLAAYAGDTRLVSDVDLDLPAGRIVTLFGPSGAGKTTIGAAVAGATAPGIRLAGTVRVRAPAGTGVPVGYLPQHAAGTLNPARRIGSALGELLDRYDTDADRATRRQRIVALLRRAAFEPPADGLDRWLRRYPVEFSGGQRTRLALAQVLAARPAALVLDEPTTGLDPVARDRFADSVAALRGTGTAVLLITHDPVVADRLSDEVRTVPGGTRTGRPPVAPAVPAGPVRSGGEVVLAVREVSVARRRQPVLRDVSLAVRSGELHAVLGVSGAGKSTLARIVAGLARADTGTVRIDGERFPLLRRRSRRQLAAVQYVWQEAAASFEPRRTVLDQVATTAVRLRRCPPATARAEALAELAALGIDERQSRRVPDGLSGGQLQRAAIARALLARPRLVLCDEVGTGLDRPLAEAVLDHLDAYRRRTGAAVLAIGHDLPALLARADRVTVLHDGRVVAAGTPGRLPASTDPAVRALLRAAG